VTFFDYMDYKKITIITTPFKSWLNNVLIAQFAEVGFDSFVETERGFEAFIPEKDFNEEAMQNVLQVYQDNFQFEVETEFIADQNWNVQWEKNYFKPLLVAGECLIRAPFHKEYPPAKYEIVIEPNMAFGTGNHETTALVIETILQSDLKGKQVLDMGCGTGILGILASMKGAEKVTAIDIDEWSYNGTIENSVLNRVKNIVARQGDASLLGTENFDIILANIHKNVLLKDLPVYMRVLHPGGKLILSGFYKIDIPEIKTKAESLGLIDLGFKSCNNWVAHSFQKQS